MRDAFWESFPTCLEGVGTSLPRGIAPNDDAQEAITFLGMGLPTEGCDASASMLFRFRRLVEVEEAVDVVVSLVVVVVASGISSGNG
jgi:hypothetical protein